VVHAVRGLGCRPGGWLVGWLVSNLQNEQFRPQNKNASASNFIPKTAFGYLNILGAKTQIIQPLIDPGSHASTTPHRQNSFFLEVERPANG
jgi:hypothetical protein